MTDPEIVAELTKVVKFYEHDDEPALLAAISRLSATCANCGYWEEHDQPIAFCMLLSFRTRADFSCADHTPPTETP
jgi:hypothetical protein